MTEFIQSCIGRLKASKIGSMLTDNAATMTCVWHNIVNDTETCGDCTHIHFMSCAAHMLHNFVKEVCTDTKHKETF